MTTKSSSVKGGIYVRISKDKTGLRAGVERQLADCRAKAEQVGWPVVRVYTDNDISAYNGKPRPDYQALFDDIAAGRVNAVVAWHPDRLHRSPTELEDYIRLCGELVQNTTVQAGFWDLSTPSGRMNARNMGNYARYESEHKSERVKAAKMAGAKAGEHNGGIRCYGYESDGITVRESEAVEIRAVADAIVRGVSLRSLARDLNERGIPTATGNAPWSQAKLRSVMLSPRLAGFRSHRERDDSGNGVVTNLYRGQWPAILDETAYEAMKAVLEDPKRAQGPRMGRTPTALGTGLYVCGVCGKPTMRRAKSSGGWPIYRCGGAGNGGKHVSRHAEALDEFVTDAIIGRLSQPGFIKAFADRVSAHGNAEKAALITERDEIRSALDELAQASESGAVTAALAIQLARQTRELTERADEIKHLLAQAGEQSPVAVLIGADDIGAAWHALTLPMQRAILAAVAVVTVNPGKRGPQFDADSIDVAFT
jgi:DNA invertase Pin-like site-specific DNA recombinase